MMTALALLLAAASQQEGWTRLKRGAEEIEVYRDRWGIAHLFAPSVEAAFWAEGWTEAEDRLSQMDSLRRSSKGQAAEVRGREALAGDRDRLRRGYTEAEFRALFEAGSDRFRSTLTAFAAGVNAYLAQARPAEPMRPWAETDSVAIGVAMARRFGEAGDLELTVSRIYDTLAAKVGEKDARLIIGDLARDSDPSAPATLHDHLRAAPVPPREKGLRRAPGMGDEAWALYRTELEEVFAARERMGAPVYFGSNAWVAGPKKSATGNPLLYGGPMMGFGTPSLCNEIHLVAPGLDVAGMSFPGVPGVMIGWNDRVAWTTTSGGADLVDVFTLELNPENPEEYRYQGGWRKFDAVEHEVKVKGEEPVKLRVLRSVHGPLAGEPDRKNLRAHALKMSFWMREQRTFEAVLDMNFSRTVGEFEAAAKKIVTSHNFFCATSDGHIGFWFCGAHPVRKAGHDRRFPQEGGGAMDWEGILDPSKWPQSVDPPHAFYGNWNNKPARDWEPTEFGKIFWGKKILDILEGEPKFGIDRFAEIARLTAYHHFTADYFKPHILEAAKGSDDEVVRRAAGILSGWDHMETEGAPGPVLMERWLRGMVARMFGPIADPLLLANKDVQRAVADPLLYLLEGERAPVKLKYDYARGRDVKAMILAALKEAMKGEPAWKEPTIDFKGGVGSLKSKRGRGTYQMTVEMRPEGPRAITLVAPGQSERPASPHYKDQLGMFEKWAYKPFLWRRDEMK